MCEICEHFFMNLCLWYGMCTFDARNELLNMKTMTQSARREWLLGQWRNSALTRADFASKVGINVSMFSELCSHRDISDRTLARVSKALAVPYPTQSAAPAPVDALLARLAEQERRVWVLEGIVRELRGEEVALMPPFVRPWETVPA